MADLYVSGLDLTTGRVVQAEEREVRDWKKKGYNGDGTLVCLQCYLDADGSEGARVVPLVPRGRIGGVRRRHFAHPPGMGLPGGHHPETAWHLEVKYRLCQWARMSGATARVEVWTADGRRRSDVAVTLPDGARLAIEVQYGQISDAELLDRRDDYARAGIAVVWVWHSQTQIPHVLFRSGEAGWVFDSASGRMGLACGQAHGGLPVEDPTTARTCGPHCPPCVGDELELRWMPLADVRPTGNGFLPSPQILACLQQEAAEATQRIKAEQEARQQAATAAVPRPRARPPHHLRHDGRGSRTWVDLPSRPHMALRIDALPPWHDPIERMYWCPQCGGYPSGADLQSSPFFHKIPGPDRIITAEDLRP